MTVVGAAASVIAIVGVALSYATSFWFLVQFFERRMEGRMDRLESRMDRVEDALRELTSAVSGLRVDVARIGERFDDHIADHPGPGASQRLVR